METIYKKKLTEIFEFRKYEKLKDTRLENALSKLGRQIIISEKMAYYEKNRMERPIREKIYFTNFKKLVEHYGIEVDQRKISFNVTLKTDKDIFKELLPQLISQPKYAGKFIAIIKGQIEGVDTEKIGLVKKMYGKFGNIKMYVGKVSSEDRVRIIDSPEIN